MDLGLEGKVAFVAASSRGLGRAIAEELHAEGATVACSARRVDHLPYYSIAADLTQPGQARRAVEATIEHFGRVDILVTNAGGPPAGGFEQHNEEAWRDAYRHNLESVVELIHAALPGMKQRHWGRIINVASISVKQPVDNLILSNSIRAAVVGMARTLANEVAPYNVTVNNALPGYTRTERIEELTAFTAGQTGKTEDEVRAVWEKQIPMGRLGEPREFAALVAFLASERASYITGTSITVDGGWVKSLL